jgi:hypothetical protein
MQNGGCHPVDGCGDGTGFAGADFQYLSANVVQESNGETLFPAYSIQNFDGARVAFIGMTLEGTPTIVSPSGVAGLDFLDEADTVNALVPELKPAASRQSSSSSTRAVSRTRLRPRPRSTSARVSPGRLSTSRTGSMTRSTSSSRAIPISPTTV